MNQRLVCLPLVVAALWTAGIAAAAPISLDEEVVAIVERRGRTGEVEARRVLTRSQFQHLSRTMAPELTGRTLPWMDEADSREAAETSEEEGIVTDSDALATALGLDGGMFLNVSPIIAPPEEPEPVEQPTDNLTPQEMLESLRSGNEPLLIRQSVEPIVGEDEVENVQQRLAQEGDAYRALPEHLQASVTSPFTDDEHTSQVLERQMQRLQRNQTEDPSLQSYNRNMRRLRRQYEHRVIEHWSETALVTLESERQGHSVYETDIDAALLPLLQVHLDRLNELEEEELTISGQQIEQLERTAHALESNGSGRISLSERGSLRDEIARVITATGTSPDDFYADLHDRLMADKFIRALIYQVYGEEHLRDYHNTHKQEFIIPRRFQLLRISCLWQHDTLTAERMRATDAFEDLQRSLRRIDDDEDLDMVVIEWQERMQRNDDLPNLTFMSLTQPQPLLSLQPEIARAIFGLDLGETSPVIELMPEGMSQGGLAVVRMVDILEQISPTFEEVRSQVEDVYFNDTRAEIVSMLRGEQGPYREWRNRTGAPLSKALNDLGSL